MNTRIGAPDWIRTSGLQSRSLSLYPAELRAHLYIEVRVSGILANKTFSHFHSIPQDMCKKARILTNENFFSSRGKVTGANPLGF